MLYIPKEKPIFKHLNSYYLHIDRLIEHCQAELGTGGIQFKSALMEAIVYFEEDNIPNVILREKGQSIGGIAARDRLIEALEIGNFTVSVYQIDPDIIFYWASLSNTVDHDLEIEDTAELYRLVDKLSARKLTGYVRITLENQPEDSFVFLYNGRIVGISNAHDNQAQPRSNDDLSHLVSLSKQTAAAFTVKSVILGASAEDQPADRLARILDMIHDLMSIFNKLVKKDKQITIDFYTLLRKKLIEKADRYDFLDPFAGEFKFNPDSVEFSGNASPEQLIEGFLISVNELAEDLNMVEALSLNIEGWTQKYEAELKTMGLSL